MEPELKSIHVVADDFGENTADFSVLVEAEIGPVDAPGGDLFTLTVTSPSRLYCTVSEGEVEIGRGLLIMADFNLQLTEAKIRQLVSKCSGQTWNEIALQLCRYMRWEFE